MGLNIDTEEALRLAEELARVTGETLTDAVTIALRERLEKVRPQEKPGLAERLLAIGRETAPLWKEPWKSMDHGDLLYDENGLPK
ncbi:type II toxin-antitoxin system VapB family antitoxin [Rhodoplanes sp. SY1]|uniref:type II toxin-antitoxin system VapB family antitoxin n=1 Tax=Rhodoplanes sp. SY1 TaxID=3166646 RepID=UPI0038B64879